MNKLIGLVALVFALSLAFASAALAYDPVTDDNQH